MSISGISSSSVYGPGALRSMDGTTAVTSTAGDDSGSTVGATQSKKDSFRSDFASLLQAIKGGDMDAAQSALGALQTDMKASSAGYSPDSSSASVQSTAVSPAQTDLDALFKAVQSGDLSTAQSSLAQLQSDAKPPADAASGSSTAGAGGAHRHHGHHGGGGLEAAVAAAFSATAGTSSDSASGTTGASSVSTTAA